MGELPPQNPETERTVLGSLLPGPLPEDAVRGLPRTGEPGAA